MVGWDLLLELRVKLWFLLSTRRDFGENANIWITFSKNFLYKCVRYERILEGKGHQYLDQRYTTRAKSILRQATLAANYLAANIGN